MTLFKSYLDNEIDALQSRASVTLTRVYANLVVGALTLDSHGTSIWGTATPKVVVTSPPVLIGAGNLVLANFNLVVQAVPAGEIGTLLYGTLWVTNLAGTEILKVDLSESIPPGAIDSHQLDLGTGATVNAVAGTDLSWSVQIPGGEVVSAAGGVFVASVIADAGIDD